MYHLTGVYRAQKGVPDRESAIAGCRVEPGPWMHHRRVTSDGCCVHTGSSLHGSANTALVSADDPVPKVTPSVFIVPLVNLAIPFGSARSPWGRTPDVLQHTRCTRCMQNKTPCDSPSTQSILSLLSLGIDAQSSEAHCDWVLIAVRCTLWAVHTPQVGTHMAQVRPTQRHGDH